MLDFLIISHSENKKGFVEVFPIFKVGGSVKDLMIKGNRFYAIWNESAGLWSTDQDVAINLMDLELKKYTDELKKDVAYQDKHITTKYFWNSNSGSIDKWNKYIQKQMWDHYELLDKTIIFSDAETTRDSLASKKLPYAMGEGSIDCYEKLIGTLYTPEEKQKLEWAIGSIIAGDSKKLQKFIVLYGEGGSGKGTFLKIVQKLFSGYCESFNAKQLGSSNNMFAMEAFKDNPLVAIDTDGDLSRIEDNTKLNAIISHETMEMNEKYKSSYQIRLDSFLMIGSNRPVKITEAKSGLIRRLIDVSPSGSKVPPKTYNQLVDGIDFELGAIAQHCYDVYKNLGLYYYDDYMPNTMMGMTNDFYDFVGNYVDEFRASEYVQLKDVWDTYRKYCDYAQVPYPLSMRAMKAELKNYFYDYKEDTFLDGKHLRNVYVGFRVNKFFRSDEVENEEESWIRLTEQESRLDVECGNCYAQYANEYEVPMSKWDGVTTQLKDLDTSLLHYVMLPLNHIVIDFDLKDANGNKSLGLNLRAANKWPQTYVEVSKGGNGLHLHYFYHGDVTQLERLYAPDIEIKVFTGNSSLRRRLSKCNDIDIATISSGLPLKGAKKVVDFEGVKNEKAIRTLIQNCLEKKHHGYTKPEIDLIYKTLEDAYNSGMEYDVSDLKYKVLAFANNSSNQSQACLKIVSKMKFSSDKVNAAEDTVDSEDTMVFFDVEVFPNLFVICWKKAGESEVHKLINPTAMEVEELTKYRLVGFNNRRYDNHILYGRILGYDEHQLYELSRKIIDKKPNATFSGAYNISYTDVLDFAAAQNKMGLKKWEIKLGIHHQELGLRWDKEVPSEQWELVADYCVNDVVATEAVFDHLKADWTARQILADLAEMSVNSSTNSLTTKIIFGNNRKPQDEFNYRNLAEPVSTMDKPMLKFLSEACPEMMQMTHGDEDSLLPYFPGYEFKNGISEYRGIKVGEGGYVYAEPGMYGNVALLDVSSMHPHSAIAEVLFGTEFTMVFRDIVEGRVSIKHEDWDAVSKMLDGKLVPYVEKVKSGEMTSKQLADALKTAINSVYGLTSAKFDNPFKDKRNKDNIVAKRGALFMVDLMNEVKSRGFTVAHIKTDSIKIPDATPAIIDFVCEFGKQYGYTFEHEATYDKMCLVNNAVYIAKYKDGPWTATGAQFAEPYVFKNLFSHEDLVFDDYCQTKAVQKGDIYIDMNENLSDGEHDYQFIGRVGQFCPIKSGHGGGELYRYDQEQDKYFALPGTKGYRWLESENVKNLKKEDDIDTKYFDSLVDEAVKNITEHSKHKEDVDWFISDEEYDGLRLNIPF